MKSSKIALLGLCALAAASCGRPSARIDGTVDGASDKQLVVKLLDVNTYDVLDTVKTDRNGRFSYEVKMEKGQPEFIYIYYGDTKISSLLLQAGDKVKVSADTLGLSSVEGSEESARLLQVEKDYADFMNEFSSASTAGDANRSYINYYRNRLRYVMENPTSLTVIPVLFQTVGSEVYVFSQTTDAIQFRKTVDTLKTVYPQSKYVASLEKETVRREQILGINTKLAFAEEKNYPEIRTKDINGKEVVLSEIGSKAILVHFWTVTDAASKIFNQDVLKPLYADYHSKGLEILEISLDTDKAAWASVVKSQELPWINANDGLGASSPTLTLYNVSSLPQSFLIIDGKIANGKIDGEKGLRKLLDSSL